jgi:hypothetical protein
MGWANRCLMNSPVEDPGDTLQSGPCTSYQDCQPFSQRARERTLKRKDPKGVFMPVIQLLHVAKAQIRHLRIRILDGKGNRSNV